MVSSSVSSGESDYSGFSDNVRMHRASPSQSRLGSDNSGNGFRVSPSLPFKIPQVMVTNYQKCKLYNILFFSIVV